MFIVYIGAHIEKENLSLPVYPTQQGLVVESSARSTLFT